MRDTEVVAAIIHADGKIYATQRGYGWGKGKWEFPGGKMEPGETQEQALKREIREELDADIAIERFLFTVNHDYEEFHLTLHCFLCHFQDCTPTLLEHSDARWVDAETVWDLDWLPADVAVIEKLEL